MIPGLASSILFRNPTCHSNPLICWLNETMVAAVEAEIWLPASALVTSSRPIRMAAVNLRWPWWKIWNAFVIVAVIGRVRGRR